jgi:putative DNA primase/helicase
MTEETPSKSLVESSVFKNISGGAVISARPLYSHPYTYRARTKLIFACNEMPRTFDTSFGLMRRLLIVPFKAEFTDARKNKDTDIDNKLKKELPGIFNKCIEAYKKCQERKELTKSKTIDNAVHSYEREVDFTLDWLEKNLKIHELGNGHDEQYQSIPDLFSCYTEQSEKDGFRPINKHYFGKKLSKFIKDYEQRTKVKKVNNKAERVLIGVTRLSEEEF